MPLDSGGDTLQVGGLCGVPGRGTQESGEGPGAAWDGESSPESSTFSGDEEEKGEGLEVKPRLLEPGRGKGPPAPDPTHTESCQSPRRPPQAEEGPPPFNVLSSSAGLVHLH